MKHNILFLFLALLLLHPKAHCQSTNSDQNYVKVTTPLIGTTSTTNLTTANSLQTIQYFDGLGRLIQVVQKGITPSGADLATYQEYDEFGRESNTWLPVAVAGNNGAFVKLSTITSKAASTYPSDSKPYAKVVYETSPLNRITHQYGPGQAWHNSSSATQTDYFANNTSYPCRLYQLTSSGNTIIINRATGAAGDYPAGQLHVTKLTDEDKNIFYEFKDKLGQVVLTRQMDGTTCHDTYYIYDDYGNKCAVLPPKLVDKLTTGSWAETNADVTGLAYLYKYDGRNRCIAAKLPGAGWTYYIYDKADRLIFSQDAEQRLQGEWTFSIPDVFGRIAITGICKQVNGNANITGTRFKNNVIYAEFSKTGVIRGYNVKADANAMTINAPQVLSTNYYDNYDFLSLTGYSTLLYQTPPSGYGTRNADNTKALLTGSFTGDAARGGTTALYSAFYYDNRSRLIQTRSTNHLGGRETEYTAYNFTGQPTATLHEHTAPGRATQTEYYTYEYDHGARLKRVKHKLGSNGTETILASDTYDELGRLLKSEKAGQTSLTQTYSYNIRSWMMSVRSTLFNEDLTYGLGGNIKSMAWTTAGQTRKYTFSYDGLSRLKTSAYTGIGSEKYGTAYQYDKQGNMTYLERYGKIAAGTAASSYGLIDQLTMAYSGNQLTGVTEAARNVTLPESGDFKKYSTAATGYSYNQNGSMNRDLNKGISSISYNYLNLPQVMDIKSPVAEARNEYQYAADGRKLKVTQRWNPAYSTSPVIGSAVNVGSLTKSKVTEYVGNKVYEKLDAGAPVLKRILVDGGYMEGGRYYFYLTDHLGNNRVVADASGAVIQRNHYYPFGMMFAEVSSAEQSKQPYQYNGKELDRMHGLNMYDYSARIMDFAVPRFTTMDPHAENYYSLSPYAYCGNNPMLNIDPFGEDYWSTNDADEIERLIRALRYSPDQNLSEKFDYSSWKHTTDAEFTGNLTFNDETNTFHVSYGTVENGELTVIGFSIKAEFVDNNAAFVQTKHGEAKEHWRKQAWGGITPVYPEFALTRGGMGIVRAFVRQLFSNGGTTNTFDAGKSGFAKGGQQKGERNRTAKAEGTDNPYKKYKPDPKKPGHVEYKDVNGRTKSKPAPEGFQEYWNKKHPSK